MNNNWLKDLGQIGLIASLAVAGSRDAIAQIVPDRTLGNENSVVVPINAQLEHIQGGALRGSNLFHSFQEFNVQNGHSAYFLNPAIVENIFSRVTGANVSEIFGTLGVLGEANLYLINPNGIIFGENASLDIKGSFVATTASSLVFGDGSEYSAVNPEIPGIIINNVPIQISLQFEGEPATIINLGNLSTGESLTLAGENLELEGELVAGEDLTLTAEETVKIRDREGDRFIAAAGNNLLVQGNEGVDIFALNHAESGLFSGGDMILRSSNAVIGDAHYYSGGSFRIEELDGDLGELESPNDPVIFADEDVFLSSYNGGSLHILAGGFVFIPGNIQITRADNTFIREDITLSDETTTISIDGRREPTLDIRAGIDWVKLRASTPGNRIFGFIFPFPILNDLNPNSSSADIVIGDVVVDSIARDGGQVFLSNQYFPNTTLGTFSEGIVVNAIETKDIFGGGYVTIDSRSGISINGEVDVSAIDLGNSNFLGNGGNINLIAKNDIVINSGSSLTSVGNVGGNITIASVKDIFAENSFLLSSNHNSQSSNLIKQGGDILLDANSIFLENGTLLFSATLGQVDSGSIILNAIDTISIQGENNQGVVTAVGNQVALTGIGNAGNVNITTSTFELLDGAQISASVLGQGNSGNITINSTDKVRFHGQNSRMLGSSIIGAVENTGIGNAGDVNITTSTFELLDGAQISASVLGQGNSGNITINSNELVHIRGENSQGDVSALASELNPNGIGNAGEIHILTKTFELLDGAAISTSTGGQGNAGRVSISSTEVVRIQGQNSQGDASRILNRVGTTGVGNAKGIEIETGVFELFNEAQITASILGQGNGGDIIINANDNIYIQEGGTITANTLGQGDGGDIIINANDNIHIQGGGTITANTLGQGNGGDIIINAKNTIRIQGENGQGIVSEISSKVRENGRGNAGVVRINTETLEVLDNAIITTDVQGQGNGNKIAINAINNVRIQGEDSKISSQVTPTGRGSAGDVSINTRVLGILDGASISVSTFGKGNAGDIEINATENIHIYGANSLGTDFGIFSQIDSEGIGNTGNIKLNTKVLEILDGARISVSIFGRGDGGNIILDVTDTIRVQGSNNQGFVSGVGSSVHEKGVGNGGSINIITEILEVLDRGQIGSSIWGQGNGGNIMLNTDSIRIQGFLSGIGSTVEVGAIGDAGEINIATEILEILDGALINVSTNGKGNAGNVNIDATNRIQIQGEDFQSLQIQGESFTGNVSAIGSVVNRSGEGDAGEVNITTETLEILEGAGITTGTFGRGNAGSIFINATDRIRFEGKNSQGVGSRAFSRVGETGIGDAGRIEIVTNTLEFFDESGISTTTNGQGIAGIINLQMNQLNLTEGSQIRSNTSSNFNAGDINLNITDRIDIQGENSGVFANTEPNSTGNGGDIDITTPTLSLQDNATINVNSQGEGIGGDIEIQADRLDLDNSKITAETLSTQGGNIDLTVRDLLLMRHGSKISTTAGTAQAGGDGGNITIDAENGFIVGPPSEDNDITANAFEGNGGNINIIAQAIFGLDFRNELTPLSDITASSEFGLDGTVQLNTLGIDPSNGLTNLPEEQNDPEVRQGCSTGGANSSSFTVQGIGGAPDNPDDMLTAEIDDEFISLDELETDGTIEESEIAFPDEKRSPLTVSCQ